jgi:CubicO group peptidase (beta-lactamase class C family)
MNMVIEPKYQEIADLFFAQQERYPLGGSSLAIFKDGAPVVNIWQGEAEAGKPWTQDTTSVVFSCAKGLTSILAHRLIQEGKLDLEEKVSHYWPEFAQAGKQDIPVKWLLQHKAGLSATRRALSIDEITDGHTIEDELAAQEPLWEPGTAHGYHALTFGTLIGKLIHNITGLTAGKYFAQLIAEPLGVDAWIGLPKEKFANLAPLISDGNRPEIIAEPNTDLYWQSRAMSFGGALNHLVESYETGFNNPQLIEAELPAAGAVSNAHSLAKIYSAAVIETDGVRLLEDETLQAAVVPQSTGPLKFEPPVGTKFPAWGNGFMVDVPGLKDLLGPSSFGHDGLGGQNAFGDFEHHVGFAYTSNYLLSGADDQWRQQVLIRKLKEILN